MVSRVAARRRAGRCLGIVIVGLFVLSSSSVQAASAIADGGFESGVLAGPALPPMPLSFGQWERRDTNSRLANPPEPVHTGNWSAVVDTRQSAIGSFIIQDFDAGDASYRWSFWVYPSVGIEGTSVGYNWDRGVTGARQTGSAVGFTATETGFAAWDAGTTLPPVTFGAWHHVEVVADRCTRTQTLTIDGQAWGTLRASAGLTLPSGVATVFFGDGSYIARHGLYYWDDFSFDLYPCSSGCPLSQGFWKTHPSAWPVATMALGSTAYGQDELRALLWRPVRGDASLVLAKQLIAAKLNVANGSDPTPVAGAIAQADALLATFPGSLPYRVKPSTDVGRAMTSLAATLDQFNNGSLTPGCPTSDVDPFVSLPSVGGGGRPPGRSTGVVGPRLR